MRSAYMNPNLICWDHTKYQIIFKMKCRMLKGMTKRARWAARPLGLARLELAGFVDEDAVGSGCPEFLERLRVLTESGIVRHSK